MSKLTKRPVDKVLDAIDGKSSLFPNVFVPPGMKVRLTDNEEDRAKLRAKLFEGAPLTMEDNKLRIERELDPVGMAIAICQGLGIPVYHVREADDGSIFIDMEVVHPSERERMKLLTKLLDKYLPDVKVDLEEDAPKGKGPLSPEMFLQAVKRAAEEVKGVNLEPAIDISTAEKRQVEDE